LHNIDFGASSTLPAAASVRAECQLAVAERALGNHAEAMKWLSDGLRRGDGLVGSAQLDCSRAVSARSELLLN